MGSAGDGKRDGGIRSGYIALAMTTPTLWLALWTLASAPSATVFDCGPATHDAGVVAQGRVRTSEVTCRNATDRSLDLREVSTGCPCLAATVSPGGEIPPGGTVRIRLQLSTDGLTDRVGFPVEGQIRGVASPVSLFHYESDVRPAVVAYPQYLDLGDWKKGGEKTLLLVDTTGASFGIQKATSARGTVDVRWTQVGLLRTEERWTITSGKSAVSGYLVTIQPRLGAKEARRSLSDEVQVELKHAVQQNVRVRIVGFSP